MTPSSQSTRIRAVRTCSAFAALILSVALTACGNDSPTQPTSASVVGTWNLQTIDGNGLPYVVDQVGSDTVAITGDVLKVSANGTFSQMTYFRVTENGQVTTDSIPDAGSYALNGTAVTFTFDSDGSTSTASLSGKTLTVAAVGLALVYKKQ
jgi:lipocalin-like protein